MSEDDERTGSREAAATTTATATERPDDNSLGRLLTLCDGIFAIAMTLLALDLVVPDIEGHVTEHALAKALGDHVGSYLSFALSFYIVMNYWLRHRQLMRFVVAVHPALIRDTMILLLIVAAMPFPAGLLGRYGSQPIALALYGGVNVLAVLTLIVLSYDIRRLGLLAPGVDADDNDYGRSWQTWLNLGVFALCIPAGFVLGHTGPYVLLLLVIPSRVRLIGRLIGRHK